MADVSDIQQHQEHLSNSPQQVQQMGQQTQNLSDPSGQSTLNIRLLMQGKEAGSIIGKKGDNIKRFRETSGAKINVSDSSCPDRIVSLVGTLDEVYNALSMICSKLEEQVTKVSSSSSNIIASSLPSSTTNVGSNLLLGNSANSVMDSLFRLPSPGLGLNDPNSLATKEADILTINNNNTTTINNNNISVMNKNNNLSPTGTQANSAVASSGVAIHDSATINHPNITIRLIIPASQCGSLIGRGGSKIKDIREMTNASVQVAPDVLPSSTERVVTISGNVESLKKCAYQICMVLLESPPKGYTIPYRPKPGLIPMFLAAAAAASANQAAVASYNSSGFSLPPLDASRLWVARTPMAGALVSGFKFPETSQQAQVAPIIPGQPFSHEFTIPNGLIGCVIGKGGSKINEIRQMSGANIKISKSEEGAKNRTITINGTPENVGLAYCLISQVIE